MPRVGVITIPCSGSGPARGTGLARVMEQMQRIPKHPLEPRTVYGPYLASDGVRHIVILMLQGGGRKTMAFARYRLECVMGRELKADEQADHINEDPSDDRWENLQLLSPGDNIRKSHRQMQWFYFLCPVCGEAARKPAAQYRYHQLRLGKAGPYCSKQCAGKANQLRK